MAKKKQDLAPQSKEELNRFISELGLTAAEIRQIQIELAQEIAAAIEPLQAEALKKWTPKNERGVELREAIYAYAQKHRTALTDNEARKTVELLAGLLQWRFTPPAVHLAEEISEDEAVAQAKKLGLDQFVRQKEVLDREAMLKEPAEACRLEGVTIRHREDFVIKPLNFPFPIVRKSRRTSKLEFEEPKEGKKKKK